MRYYINIRRLKTELDFFDTDVGFFARSVNDLEAFLPSLGSMVNEQMTRKASVSISDKNKMMKLISTQLTDPNPFAEDLLSKNQQELAKAQALGYPVHDLVQEFRQIKIFF